MVNPIIYDYLRNYGSSFKLEDIRNKILSSGYSEDDFNEAVSAIRFDRERQKQGQNQNLNKKPRKNIKWLKISGIFGIFLLIVFFAVFVFVFFINNIGGFIKQNPSVINTDLTQNKIIYLSFIWLFAIVFSIFYFGFVKIGQYTESKPIKYSSILFIILILLAATLFSGILITKEPIRRGLTVIDPDNPGPPPISLVSQKFIIDYEVPLAIAGSIILVLSIFSSVFSSIGLALIKWKIKFSKISVILNFIVIIFLVVLIGILVTFQGISDNILYLEEFGIDFIIVAIAFNLIIFLNLLAKTLILFDAHKNFEGKINNPQDVQNALCAPPLL